METIKISDTSIEITKVVASEEVKNVYERSFIENQIKSIQKSKDDFDALRDKEIKECLDILAEMDKLNIVATVDVVE